MVVGHIVGDHRRAATWQPHNPGPYGNRCGDRADTRTAVNVDIHTAMAAVAIDVNIDITDAAAGGPGRPMRTSVRGRTYGMRGVDERQLQRRRPGKSDQARPNQVN
jgi:hypothetical protein